MPKEKIDGDESGAESEEEAEKPIYYLSYCAAHTPVMRAERERRAAEKAAAEKAATAAGKPTVEFTLNLLSATGTGILLSAIVGGLVMKYNPLQLIKTFGSTLWLVRYSLLTIVLMLGLGSLTRYSGTDTTLGLAFANTGWMYPFFGTLMGWLGVALTRVNPAGKTSATLTLVAGLGPKFVKATMNVTVSPTFGVGSLTVFSL